MCRFNVPGHVRGLYCGIGCTFEPLAAERRRLLGSPLLRRLTALPPRQQDRAGEPAGRSRDMLKLVRPCRPSLASSVVKGVKERNILEVRGHRFGLGQLLRGRVRPMAEDSPSGERLAGQSGLVFHIGVKVRRFPRKTVKALLGVDFCYNGKSPIPALKW